MALVAELITELKVQDSGFYSAMKGATSAAAVFVSTIALVSMAVDKSAERINEMARNASKISVTVEAFQQLSYAARMTDTPISSLQNGLKFLAKNIDDANVNGGAMADNFKRLGLNAKELEEMSIDQALLKVSDAMKTIPNTTAQTAIALKLLGRGGIEDMNLLRSNITGLENEFNKLGITITAKQAEQAETFVESKKKLGAIFEGFSGQVGAQLTPIFTDLMQDLTKSITSTTDLGEVAKVVASDMIGSFKFMVDGAGIFLTALDQIIDRLNKLQVGARLSMLYRFAVNTASGANINAGDTAFSPNMIGSLGSTAKSSNMSDSMGQLSALASKAQAAIWSPVTDSFIPSIRTASTSVEEFAKTTKAAKGTIDGMIKSQAASLQGQELSRILGDSIKGLPIFKDDKFDQTVQQIYKMTSSGGAKSNSGQINELLQKADAIAHSGAGDSMNHAPDIAIVKDLRQFVKEQGGTGIKPLSMNIIVQSADGFNLKIANSPQIRAVIKNGLATLMADEAASVGK